MEYAGTLAVCKVCQSYRDGKCTDCFEPGVKYACVNLVKEPSDGSRRNDNRR